jgi:hypothetical protein
VKPHSRAIDATSAKRAMKSRISSSRNWVSAGPSVIAALHRRLASMAPQGRDSGWASRSGVGIGLNRL